MASSLLITANARVHCAHGGQAQPTSLNPHLRLQGQPAPLANAPYAITGCSAAMLARPCQSANWQTLSATHRVKSMGQPLLLQSSRALGVPSGALLTISSAGQTRVKAA
jgi:hypothetical protein